MAHDIRLCCLARAGIKVASHDPPWNSTVEKSLCGQFEVAFLSQLKKTLKSNPSTGRKIKNHVDINVNGLITVVLLVSEPLSKYILLDSLA
jgi:hypothetical protein